MRSFKRNDRVVGTSKWAPHILLVLVGLLMVISEPVQTQQTSRKQPPTRKCTVPAEELESLIILLDDIEQPPRQEESEEDSEDAEDSDESLETPSGTPRLEPQCTRELKRLRQTVDHLQRSYHELKQNTITIDEREYRHRENRYAQQKRQLTARLEELTKQINPRHRAQLNDLRSKILDVQKQLSNTVAKVAEQRQQNVNHYIQLVASNIRSNNLRSAITNFNLLITYNTDPYGAIVQKVFQTGNAPNTYAMLNFLQMVDFQHRPVSGYVALVDALIERSALYGANAIELLKHIQCLILARDGNQQAQALALLKKFKSTAH